MNTSVDVLVVIDGLSSLWRDESKIVGRWDSADELDSIRAAVAELIEADEEFDAAGESLEFIQNSTSPRVGSYAMLNAAIERYEYSRIRRSAALARVRGEQ